MDQDQSTKIEDFHGVYLLSSKSPDAKYRGRCYVGYTVNPNRRIKQHNKGVDYGGARKTNNKGPWTMVMIVHGFPNNISALQFEWAWQWPRKSNRLKHIKPLQSRLRKESNFDYHFRVLSYMLNTGPWNRLPLFVRWFASEFQKEFPIENSPPIHMQIVCGSVLIGTKPKKNIENNETDVQKRRLIECHLCMKTIMNAGRSRINCINPKCILTCHMTCLANVCLESGHYIPIEGACPICNTPFLWGDLIRKKNGCNDLVYTKHIPTDSDLSFDSESDISISSDEDIPGAVGLSQKN